MDMVHYFLFLVHRMPWLARVRLACALATLCPGLLVTDYVNVTLDTLRSVSNATCVCVCHGQKQNQRKSSVVNGCVRVALVAAALRPCRRNINGAI